MKRRPARKRRDRRGNLSSYSRKGKKPHKYEGTPQPHDDRARNTTSPRAIEAFNERLGIRPWVGGNRRPLGYPEPLQRLPMARRGRHMWVVPHQLSPEAKHARTH